MNSEQEITIKTIRFGDLQVHTDRLITMPNGILGFPECKRYVMLDHDEESPFKWLQCADDPDLAFVVTDPLVFFHDYRIDVKPEELGVLELKNAQDAAILVILSLVGGPRNMTANLQGPIIINSVNRVGKQVVLKEGKYNTRHGLFPDLNAEAVDDPAEK